ncbi:MAG: ABC transporter ATP-binding protein [Elusimicrobia bacterium]|nr:ABC transporter ATP-binding protein [Elusimicrobiota bacterium]
MSAGQVLLEIKGLSVHYGGIQAVKGVSLEVRRGEIVALVGANGAGKSTTLRAISGLLRYSGEIRHEGVDLRGLPPHRIAARGIAHVPEGRGIFANLTVGENLRLSAWPCRSRAERDRGFARVFALFPRLKERSNQPGGTLSGGEQQMLALGRALMGGAGLLLLDEPSMGLSPLLVKEILAMLADINRQGVTILLVEQNANSALRMASRGYVFESGRLELSGTGPELLGDPRVREAYLGT